MPSINFLIGQAILFVLLLQLPVFLRRLIRMKTSADALDGLGRNFHIFAVVVGALTIILAIVFVFDKPVYIENVRGEVTGYSSGGQGKSGSIPAIVYCRLEGGLLAQFTSFNPYPPRNGECVEFRRYIRNYSGKNEYRFVRYC